MNLIPCSTVEFLTAKRGPGPRNAGTSDATATFTTHKMRPGDNPAKELAPTGLVILWDRASGAIFLVRPDVKEDPCVVYSFSQVSRLITVEHEWLMREAEAQAAASPKARKVA